jgi:hypothetical protein
MGNRPSVRLLAFHIYNSIGLVVSEKKIFKISANENTLWTLAAMLDFKSAPNLVEGHPMNISGKFWLKSVQRKPSIRKLIVGKDRNLTFLFRVLRSVMPI